MLQVPLDSPTRQEIKKGIFSLNNGKVTGPDGIPEEVLTADVETSAEILFLRFEHICQEEGTPQDWKEGYIVKILKKGDLSTVSAGIIEISCCCLFSGKSLTEF